MYTHNVYTQIPSRPLEIILQESANLPKSAGYLYTHIYTCTRTYYTHTYTHTSTHTVFIYAQHTYTHT